jgi:hypothetical protein
MVGCGAVLKYSDYNGNWTWAWYHPDFPFDDDDFRNYNPEELGLPAICGSTNAGCTAGPQKPTYLLCMSCLKKMGFIW